MGNRIWLLANINGIGDAKTAVAMGAGGVGLYRTEYLYLTHPDVPDEDEQLVDVSQDHQGQPGTRGHDSHARHWRRQNRPLPGTHAPGSQSLSGLAVVSGLSFEHPEFFMTQIRAVLRAAADIKPGQGEVRLMFPMITTLEEMRRVRSLVRRTQRQLAREGKPYGNVPIGMMLEVPAAAISLDTIIEVVDFVSIGSNDLIQYLMAADRDNPKVNHLCQPLSPAVLRVLRTAIRACCWSRNPSPCVARWQETRRPLSCCWEWDCDTSA